MSNPHWYEGQIDSHRDRPFLVSTNSGKVWSYGDLDRFSRDLASRLVSVGVRRGDRIAVLLDNCPEYVMLYFACLHIGCTAVSISPSLHRSEADYLATRCRASMLVLSEGTRGSLSASSVECFERLVWMQHEDERPVGRNGWSMEDASLDSSERVLPDRLDDAEIWTITYTSGTTNRPKGIPHRVASLVRSAQSFARAIGYGPSLRMCHVFPMSYMAGFLNTILCPFVSGGCVVLDRPFDARLATDFWSSVIRHQVNRLCLSPTMLAMILQLDRDASGLAYAREAIETVSVCTAPLPLDVKEAFEERYGAKILESYGLSETLFVTTDTLDGGMVGSVGRCIEGVEVAIRGDAGECCSVEEQGEIFVRTKTPMAGYLDPSTGEPDPTTMPHWFATGDLGHFDARGFLFVTGRKKDLIIRGGMNVSPRGVEDVIRTHPGVRDVAVVGLPHPLYGEDVVAVIEPQKGGNWPELRESLLHFCRERLSVASRPSRFYEMPALPRGLTGKVQKGSLRSMLSHSIPAGALQ